MSGLLPIALRAPRGAPHVATLIGGDALNGHSANGHYYLRSHGTDTEVSEGLFAYSWCHAISMVVTQPLAMVAGLRMYYRKNRDG